MSDAAKYAPLVRHGPTTMLRSSPSVILDRAMRGSLTSTVVGGNFGNVSLNNNAAQQYFLVIRNIEWGPAAAGPAVFQHNQALASGGAAGVVVPLLPDRALLPGYLEKGNAGSAPVGDYVLFNQSIGVSTGSAFPIVVLPPGWQLKVTSSVVATAITVSWLWEALTPDEFNEFYGAAL